jgi:uncharacterized membrane protein
VAVASLRARGPARVGLAVGVGGLGLLALAYGDFAPQWQSVPAWFPWPHGLAYASGVVLLAGGLGLLVRRTAAPAALALLTYTLIWVVVRGVGVLPHVASIGHWQGFCESLTLMAGSWTLRASLTAPGDPRRIEIVDGRRALLVARILFGVSCVVFGLAHFAYADFTAAMIPGWLPAHRGLAYVTGVCHLAAGLAMVGGVFARLAATLEALMLGSFVLLVHVPSVVLAPAPGWAPSPQVQWTELLLAWVIAACAGVVATSPSDRPLETPG